MKRKLENRCGDIDSQYDGKPSVICFKDTASFIVAKPLEDNQKLSESDRIILTAAMLIKTEIKATQYPFDYYPSKADIQNHETSLLLCLY